MLPLHIALTAGGYFLAGKLALLLAIPPGYATAFWPAAGLALAACLLWGPRVWPGVFLGSLLANVGTDLDSGTAAAMIRSLALPAAIAAGASLQAVCGALLIRRLVGFPLSLNRLPHVSLMVVVGGPVGCLIGASLGNLALTLAGRIAAEEFSTHWLTWWVGDSLGVAVLIPLVAAWRMELDQAQLRTKLSVILPLLLAVALTVGLFLHVRRAEWHNRHLVFTGEAEHLAQAVAGNLQNYQDVLFSIEGLFQSSRQIDRDEFHRFVAYILQRHPGIQALEWVPRVRAEERAAYEAKARADGFADFRVTEQARDGSLVPAAQRPEYAPVFFLEPYRGNEAVLGFDLASSPGRREALHSARDSGRPVATGRMPLVQDQGEEFGILLVIPVYSAGAPPETILERQARYLGAVCGVFRIPAMMEAALKPIAPEGFALALYDLSAALDEQLLYARPRLPSLHLPPQTGLDPTKLGREKQIEVGTRRWLLRMTPTATNLAGQQLWGAWAVLTGGMFFSGLLGSFLLLVVGRKVMTERVVALRTTDLQQSNRLLAVEVAEREKAERELHLAHSRLEDQVRERTRELAEANEDLRAINHLMMTCASVLDVDEILNRVMDQALAITGLEGGTICFVQPDETLHLAAHRETSPETIEDLTQNVIRIGDCLCGRCALEQKPLILRTREEVLGYSTREATRNEEIHFHAAFPLITAGRCAGILCIFTRDAHKPTERSLKLLETVSPPIALAIENANLYQQRVRYADALEETVQGRTQELRDAQNRLQMLVDELNEANVQLQDLDRAKSMFIASMSHELRTPLNSIIGFSSILLKEMPGPLNFEQKKQLKMVMGSARHLLNLINDILDISKIESGELGIASEPVQIPELIEQVRAGLAPQADKKGLSLQVSVAPAVTQITSDGRRVKQILLNLVNNAVKFTEHGGVEILCEGRGSWLEFQVRDSGIGIREQDLDKLFRSFSQLDSGLSRRYDGTGLGLFICRRLVHLLGGEIRVESRFGEGSTFSFTLPLTLEKSHD